MALIELHGITRSYQVGKEELVVLKGISLEIAEGEFRTASRLPSVRTFPRGGWKKQGRTVPSASMTAETQGALQVIGAKSPRPA